MHAHASLNRIYRLIWSALHQTWVVASELARGRGNSSSTPLLSAALLAGLAALSGGAGAAPQGGQVVSGSGSISASDATTTINQASDKLSLNWQSFNVAKSETVNFVQPSASALAVNRILDTQGSQILGKINANGQVWLINPNGVLFGKDAQINVGGLLASTLNPEDASIGSARSNFSGSSTAGVVNLGTINTAQGGYVALLGHSVSNQGNISAPGGTVALGAGSAVSLNFAGSKLLGLEVTSNQVNALAENGGLIQADGGQVLLSAGARDSLLASVVNNTGVIQARTVQEQEQDGKIILLGGMAAGITKVKGTLDASAPSGGNGGFIETSAYTVNVDDSATITTASAQGTQGRWLIDPFDFYIASSGGNITGDALGKALNSNDVTIQTMDTGTVYNGTTITGGTSGSGDIFVNDAVSWTSNKTLTLSAYRNININKAIKALNGGLTLTAGRNNNNPGTISVPAVVSVGNFNLTRGTWKQVAEQLPGFSATSFQIGSGTFIRALSGDGSNSSPYRIADVYGLQGIGSNSMTLANHYALADDIDASGTSNWDSNKGFAPIGTDSTPDSTPFTGSFDGQWHTITGLTINRPTSWSSVGLFGNLGIGGVVRNVGLVNASVIGRDHVGGLVGTNEGSISNSYVSGSVSASITAGGLVGVNSGSISNSYATGNVSGVEKVDGAVGGLVGFNNGGEISNSYATASASGRNGVGGLVGENGGSISNSYATGRVNSDGDVVGGLVGYNNFDTSPGTISNSIWDVDTTGQPYSDGGLGLRTADMLSLASYTTGENNPNWDFTNTWYMVDGATRPFLRSEWSTTVRNTHQLQLMAMNPGSSYTLANSLDLTADLANKSSMWKTGDGFSPIGTVSTRFTGSFDGQGYTITGLAINLPTTNYVGLFGYVGSGGVVKNVGLSGGSVSGAWYVGGLAGTSAGIISSSYSTGSVSGVSNVGGLVGKNEFGDISNSYATGNVSASEEYAGGLVGANLGSIRNGYATGSVAGSGTVGGLVGGMVGGLAVGFNGGGSSTVSNSYATGSVSGADFVGGLVGYNDSIISSSYATGSVTGFMYVGGLVGENNGGTVSNSYATGAVTSFDFAGGGLVGWNFGTISNTYATGRVNSDYLAGGLAGYNDPDDGRITNSYFDKDTTGLASGAGNGYAIDVRALTSAQMEQSSNFSGFDFSNTWFSYDGHTNPLLRTFLTPLSVTYSVSGNKTYDGTTTCGTISCYYTTGTLTSGKKLLGTAAFVLSSKNAGTVTVSGTGLHSDQQGYLITASNSGTATIIAAAVTDTANTASRNTEETPAGFGATVSRSVNNETQNTATTGTVARLIPPPITFQSSGLRSTNQSLKAATPFAIPLDINTFAATAAGAGSPVTSLGGTGLVFVATQGLSFGTLISDVTITGTGDKLVP